MEITLNAIQWGACICPPTCNIDRYAEIGITRFRSHYCRPDWWTWWDLDKHANFAEQIHSRGGKLIETLVDRQPCIPPFDNGNNQRMAISAAIATWNSDLLKAIRSEVSDLRRAMPKGVVGELWNGDEFGPGCGFPWDPLRDEFWKALGVPMPKGSTIRARFTRFGNEIAAIWGGDVIASSSHVYLYDDGVIRHRGQRVQPIVTEVGIHKSRRTLSSFIRLAVALAQSGVREAYWHMMWPHNPGDGAAAQRGDWFMYDLDKYESWRARTGAAWPDYGGEMLAVDQAETLLALMSRW